MRVEKDLSIAKWALTLSGKRVHLTIPLQFKSVTLCQEVVYEVVGTKAVAGRTICAACAAKASLI